MKKIRDEQKGFIFIGLIILIIVAVSIIFSISLKTNIVEETLNTDQNAKIVFCVEDTDGSLLFSSCLIYYPSSQKAALINLPGYTGSIFSTLGRVDMLKMVYQEKGISSYIEEVKKLLGIKIPFYAIIKMENFIKLTDYLGGLRVFISEPIDCTINDVRYLLPSGSVNLDGDKVYAYLHYRNEDETESDIQDRYQNVMSAFITGLSDKKFIIFNNKNYENYASCLTTNVVKADEEETLFKIISDVDAESIIKQTITGSVRNVDDKRLLFPLNNGENVRNNVRQVTNMLYSADGGYSSRVYVLEIQNGTTTQGLARNTSILFQNASYDVLSAVNADRNDYEETVIIDRIGNEEAARLIGDFIHCDNIIQANFDEEAEDYSTKASVDFTVILGKDFNGQYVVKRRSSK